MISKSSGEVMCVHEILLLTAISNNSYYPRTVKDWNELPINIIESRNLDEFIYVLNLHYCN